MSADTPACRSNPNSNKRLNLETPGSDATSGYPHKNFKVATSGAMDAHLITPFHQRLKDAFTTPSTGRTITPCSAKFSGKRDMVHRLRQQLKNRDEMIMQMQTQILEQSRDIHMQKLRIGDLELLLRKSNKSLFVAEQEMDCLHRLLAECCTCRPASCQSRKRVCLCSDQMRTRFTEGKQQGMCQDEHKEMKNLVSEARRLTEELQSIGEVRLGQERLIYREFEAKLQRIRALEAELADVRDLAMKHASMFQACDKERAKLSGALTELQQKLESQAIRLEQMRAHKISGPFIEPAKGHESENTVGTSAPLCFSTSHSSRKSQFSTDSSGVSKPESCRSYIEVRRADMNIEDVLIALQNEVDKLNSQLSILDQNGVSRLQNFEDVISDEMERLTSKLEQVAGLRSVGLPELARHRENVLTLKQKVGLLSDKFSSLKNNRNPKSCSRKKVFPEASIDNSRRNSQNERSQIQEFSNGADWSLDEDITRVSMEMEQVTVGKKSLDSPRHHDDSAGVRVGSPDSNFEETKGSFGRFVFDMDHENGVVVLNQTDENYFDDRMCGSSESLSRSPQAAPTAATVELSPFSKMMAKLDLLQQASPAVSLTDSLVVAEKIERSIGSVDSAFDRILDNTLDDMVRIWSPCKTSTSSNSTIMDL